MTNNRQLIKRMCGVAILAALSFVMTAYCAIPYSVGGYFNFGDLIDILAAYLFGPIDGSLVGIIAGVAGDLSTGNSPYALWTLLAKGLLCLSSGFAFTFFREHKILRFSGAFVGAAFDVLAYFGAYWIILGPAALWQSGFDCLQAFGCAALSIPLYLLLEKSGVTKIIQR